MKELAQQLGADWRTGDEVMPWIRRHEGANNELSQLVREGWSWTDVGLALNLVGIRYHTGAAIPGDLLRKKAGLARADERKRLAVEALPRPSVAVMPTEQQPASPALSIQAEQNKSGQTASKQPALEAKRTETFEAGSEFDFQPARLKIWGESKVSKGEEKTPETKTPPAQPPTGDADEVIAKLMGKK